MDCDEEYFVVVEVFFGVGDVVLQGEKFFDFDVVLVGDWFWFVVGVVVYGLCCMLSWVKSSVVLVIVRFLRKNDI